MNRFLRVSSGGQEQGCGADLPACPAAAPAAAALRIGFMPFGHITNRYAERFVEILGEFGRVSELPGPKSLLRRPRLPRREFDIAIVNWVEFDLVRHDGAFSILGFLKAVARILFVRSVARRLVYVRHNHYPHGTRERDVERARRAVDLIERLFDVVLIHSGHETGPGREYVPHPLYRLAPDTLDVAESALLDELPEDFYVVFGRIERYKRIDGLLDVFPPGRRLLVFGSADDAEYVNALRQRAGPNVRILAGYVSDAFAQAVIRRSRGLILCHAEPDMIVSGSFFYALSLGARIFALSTPALGWVQQRIGDDCVRIARDLSALAALVADDVPARAGRARSAAVEDEFGDARIKALLREVLFA